MTSKFDDESAQKSSISPTKASYAKCLVSVYFHIPFCTRKCPYCHFYVLPDQEPLKDLLLTGLEREWKLSAPLLQGKEITSIYFGGGTPTLFGIERLATVLSWIPHSPTCEITIETNPETTTPELMRALKSAGLNRVSIGVQSLDEGSLQMLERRHNALRAIQAIETTHAAGVDNISIDLMYELPGQTLASWERTLQQVATLPITHLSLYNLTIEPHTPFFKRQKQLIPLLPSPETSVEMLHRAALFFEENGFNRYEISAWSKPGFSSRHNLGYWTARPFLGFGPSAFSYWDQRRFRKCANLRRYSEQLSQGILPIDFEEQLPFPDNLNELLAVRLRLLEGVPIDSLPQEASPKLKALEAQGLLIYTPTHVKLSERGLLFYDTVASEII